MVPLDSWNPEQYEKFKKERSQPFHDLMGLLEQADKPRVIDLGCGTGELTRDLHLGTGAGRTVGVDNSEAMLKKAQAFAAPGLDFESADIQSWRDPGGYDIVFSNAAIQWCVDHRTVFARLRESLAPGGQLAIQMPMNHDYPTHVVADRIAAEEPFASALPSTEGERKNRSLLKPEEYARLLFDLGFQRQKVELKVYPHVLPTREDALEWVKGTMLTYYQAELPEKHFGEFMKRYREALFHELPDEKPFFYPFKRILIWGSLA